MKCPACGNELTEFVEAGIKVPACKGECGGLWFDRFQFGKLKLLKPGIGKALLTIDRAEGVKVYRGTEHACPDCKTTLLYRHFFSAQKNLEINQCSKCKGFWIDLAGLAELQYLPEDQRKVEADKYYEDVIKYKLSAMRLKHTDMAEQVFILEQILKFLYPKNWISPK
jgi:uncharacterized protein